MTEGRRPGLLWFAAIVLVAANLRPVISSVPPVVDRLTETFGFSAVAAGALTTLPVVCMGVFAPLAAVLARRYGNEAALALAVGLIALGAVGRSLVGVIGLFAGTAVAGIGIAVAGALLPSLVRSEVPDRVGPVTGLYTASLIGGALIAAGSTVPLTSLLNVSALQVLAIWTLPALLALAVSLLLLLLFRRRSRTSWGGSISGAPQFALDRRVRRPWRSRAAWLGTLFMGGQSLLFYATLAWLAASYTELGKSASYAGLLLALFSATQVITAFALPALAHKTGAVAPWIVASVGLTAVALLLVATVPLASPWLWAALIGLGMGGNLSLALTVVTHAAPTPASASAYTGMAFGVGYLLAALGPVAAGALRDATGGFTAVFATLAALGAVTLVVGVAAARTPPDPP